LTVSRGSPTIPSRSVSTSTLAASSPSGAFIRRSSSASMMWSAPTSRTCASPMAPEVRATKPHAEAMEEAREPVKP
jgi:hypothetical protein